MKHSTMLGLVGVLALAVGAACGASDAPASAPVVLKAADGAVRTFQNVPVVIGLGVASTGTQPTTSSFIRAPLHGTLSAAGPSGTVTFTPATDYVGSDSFTFGASDGATVSNVATITIDVVAAGEAMVAIAQPQSVVTNEDTPIGITLAATGVGPDPTITFAVSTPPAHGTVGAVDGETVTYSPAPNYTGSDALTFTATANGKLVTAATVTITVNPVNDLPSGSARSIPAYVGATTAIALSAIDAESDALTYEVAGATNGALGPVTGNVVTFRPTAPGPASFTFTAHDGKGAGSPVTVALTVAESAKSCLEMRRNGVLASGVYKVDPDGPGAAPSLDVHCDQASDGGGWLRVFHQDAIAGYFADQAAAMSTNEDAPTSPLYSILRHLEHFRTNGGFELRLDWPRNHRIRNVWIQTSNPLDGPVQGYRGVHTDAVSNNWGGLERSQSPAALLDGAVFDPAFWYAIGEISGFGAYGIPAAAEVHGDGSVAVTELWVRPTPTCGNGILEDLETCDDSNTADGDGCTQRCEIEATSYHDCREIHAAGSSKGDGTYVVRPVEEPLAVYCDMTRDGGGWTMIGKSTAGDYTHLSQDQYVALVMNANDHVNASALLDPEYAPFRTMAFLNRPTTNALAARSGHTVRIDFYTEVSLGSSGTFFQKRFSAPTDWDLWGAIRDARKWSDAGTLTGDSADGFGADFALGFTYDPATESVGALGSGFLGCWPLGPSLAIVQLNDGSFLQPCRHAGLIGDGFNAGYAWLFTTNANEPRFRNDGGSRQRSRLWLR